MKRFHKQITFAFSLGLLVLGLGFSLGAQNLAQYADKPLVLNVVETSDLHGALFPYDFKTDKPKDTSLSNVVTLVKELRAAKGEQLLLLDGGDNLQGQPLIYYYNFVATKSPSILSQTFNALGYDAIGLGNHDVETGHEVYDKVNKELKAGPEKDGFISANLVNEKDGKPYFTPYRIVNKGGVKIAILGLTEPAFVKNFPKILYSGIKVVDMVESAKYWVPIIQSKEKPDLLIGLFHAGVDYSYGGQKADTPSNENAAQLVPMAVPGFDAVFVGHDHVGWDGQGYDPATKAKIDVKDPTGKVVPIYGALNEARKIAVVKMTLTYNKSTKKLDVVQTGELRDMSKTVPDAAFVKQFDKQIAEAKAWVSKPIGKMEGSISSRDSMFGDSAFVDLIHQLQLDMTKDPTFGLKPAQISFCAPLSANAVVPSSADGTIYVRDMFSLYVYENWMYTMDLSGQQVKDFLEVSYDGWFNQMKDASDHLIAFATDATGAIAFDTRTNMPKSKTPSYNYDSAAGIVYDVDVSKPMGSRIIIKSMADGSAFDLAKTYSVAINSYRAMGGGGMLEKGAKISAADLLSMKYVSSATTKDLRFYLTQFIEKQTSALAPQAMGNWQVLPADWAAAGKALDYPLLYPAPVAK
jgi:2',3'-cyclic-nucleotide 2'-phosphodiesterase/3'-nucleotidase